MSIYPRVLSTLALLTLGAALAQSAAPQKIGGGFEGPQGVLVAPDGSIYVIEAGVGGNEVLNIRLPDGKVMPGKFGNSARVVRITPDGKQAVVVSLPSLLGDHGAIGGGRLAMLNGDLYVTNGIWVENYEGKRRPNTSAVLKIADGKVTEVANTWDLEETENVGGFIKDSHPYGVAVGPDGNLWVADAGANALLKVDPKTSKIQVVAVFEGQPFAEANPMRGGKNETDPVPTAVAFDKAGNAYVSLLPGSMMPGASRVMKVDSSGKISEFAKGLTAVTDLRMGPDGNLYAVQLGQFGEKGPVPKTGSVVRINPDGTTQVVLGELTLPVSVDFNQEGDAYVVVNPVGAPGSGEVLLFKSVARK